MALRSISNSPLQVSSPTTGPKLKSNPSPNSSPLSSRTMASTRSRSLSRNLSLSYLAGLLEQLLALGCLLILLLQAPRFSEGLGTAFSHLNKGIFLRSRQDRPTMTRAIVLTSITNRRWMLIPPKAQANTNTSNR